MIFFFLSGGNFIEQWKVWKEEIDNIVICSILPCKYEEKKLIMISRIFVTGLLVCRDLLMMNTMIRYIELGGSKRKKIIISMWSVSWSDHQAYT